MGPGDGPVVEGACARPLSAAETTTRPRRRRPAVGPDAGLAGPRQLPGQGTAAALALPNHPLPHVHGRSCKRPEEVRRQDPPHIVASTAISTSGADTPMSVYWVFALLPEVIGSCTERRLKLCRRHVSTVLSEQDGGHTGDMWSSERCSDVPEPSVVPNTPDQIEVDAWKLNACHGAVLVDKIGIQKVCAPSGRAEIDQRHAVVAVGGSPVAPKTAGRSRFVVGSSPQPRGPNAETACTWGKSAGLKSIGPLWS